MANGSHPQRVTPEQHAARHREALEQARAKKQKRKDYLAKSGLRREVQLQCMFDAGVTWANPAFDFVVEYVSAARRDGVRVDKADICRAVIDKALDAYDNRLPREVKNLVYYVRVGEFIKIGTTNNLDRRLKAYPPGAEVLATERGSYGLEAKRVRQFKQYLAGRREWFSPGPRLMEHIDRVKRSPGANRYIA